MLNERHKNLFTTPPTNPSVEMPIAAWVAIGVVGYIILVSMVWFIYRMCKEKGACCGGNQPISICACSPCEQPCCIDLMECCSCQSPCPLSLQACADRFCPSLQRSCCDPFTMCDQDCCKGGCCEQTGCQPPNCDDCCAQGIDCCGLNINRAGGAPPGPNQQMFAGMYGNGAYPTPGQLPPGFNPQFFPQSQGQQFPMQGAASFGAQNPAFLQGSSFMQPQPPFHTSGPV